MIQVPEQIGKSHSLTVLEGQGVKNKQKNCKFNIFRLCLIPEQLEFDFYTEGFIQRRDKRVVSVTGFNKKARYHLDGAVMYYVGFDHDIPGYQSHIQALDKMTDRMADDGIQFVGELVLTPPDRVLSYLDGDTAAFHALELALAKAGISFADAIPFWKPPRGDPDFEPYLR